MTQIHLTNRTIHSLQPQVTEYFIRDRTLRGFGVRVYPTGQVRFVTELRHQGKTYRRTLGAFPHLSLQEARMEALSIIADIKSGAYANERKNLTLKALFHQYTDGDRLKPRTVRDYKEAVFFYLSDWLDIPVASITKEMVEKRYNRIKDRGMQGGKPTFSQAAKVMRILSAMMNHAMADDLIESNPVDILRLKRISRSTNKRENYLKVEEVRELLSFTASDGHPMVLAIHLILHTGLRKNEALGLKWSAIQDIEGVSCITISETKNSRPHFLPVTPQIEAILERAKNNSSYLFPSTQKAGAYIKDTRSTIHRLSKATGLSFTVHDLRRTFATRASEVGIDFLMVKRILNHKSNDITSRYIQWDSKANLLAMKSELEKVVY